MWKIVTVVTHLCMGNGTPCIFSNHATERSWGTELECVKEVPLNTKKLELVTSLLDMQNVNIESECLKM